MIKIALRPLGFLIISKLFCQLTDYRRLLSCDYQMIITDYHKSKGNKKTAKRTTRNFVIELILRKGFCLLILLGFWNW